jgi:hypothetical protein
MEPILVKEKTDYDNDDDSFFIIGYKFFESKDGLPKSLVHSLPTKDGKRSRIYKLNTIIKKEPNTPGFNFFQSKEEALNYLPRFRKRASRLILCSISYPEDRVKKGPNYTLTDKIYIFSESWGRALNGYYYS